MLAKDNQELDSSLSCAEEGLSYLSLGERRALGGDF